MKIATIVGARPQFIKAAPVSKALAEAGHTEFLIHTGQHYDYGMSQVFFDELGLPQPDVNLGIGSGTHGRQTGQMLMAIEEQLLARKPDWLLVYGDTNSTLAGALAAAKLHIPIAHVEAGLRSFNRQMPEEHNRVLTDHCSDLLFCPTQTAVEHLNREGIIQGVHLTGDVMYDAVLHFAGIAQSRLPLLQNLNVRPKQYFLATIHRAYNTDNPVHLAEILQALASLEHPVIFPVHPRTKAAINKLKGNIPTIDSDTNLKFIEPVSYLDMLLLEENARLIITDSGGVQKEAFFFGVPCVTLRPETEWLETVESGWNKLVNIGQAQIRAAIRSGRWPHTKPPALFGDGQASMKIAAAFTRIDAE